VLDPQPIVWNSDLETGHAEIDAQHRTLVESLNRLQAAVSVGSGEEELGWCLSFLKAYTRVHFRTEEAVLADCPGWAGHQAAHQVLLKEVDELFRRFLKGELQLCQETLDMLNRWLMDHILEADRPLLRARAAPPDSR
jgi:hemerythrin-like metal-binding protein